MDDRMREAIEAGQRNAEAMELMRNWCAHARARRMGGVGMVEQMTGLPISHFSMECDHAPAGGTACWDFGESALDFYDRNCVFCTKRQPVGLPNLSRLVSERDESRRVTESEIGTAVHLFKPLANLVGQAVQDNLFPQPIDEAELERIVTQQLRRHSEVGVELEVQAHAAGGRTDLSFRQMRIELKVKNDAPLSDADLKKYALQAAAYAAGSDKTIGILCALDGSPKKAPPIPMAEVIRIIPVQPGDHPIYIITFVLQGNLAKPSSLSR